MRKTRTTAFGAASLLIAAALVAAATPALAQGSIGSKGSFLFASSKTFATQRAIGDPGIKNRIKTFRKRRAFNPQPDPPGKLRASNLPEPAKHKAHRKR